MRCRRHLRHLRSINFHLKKAFLYISFCLITLHLSSCSPKSVLTDPLLSSQTFRVNKILPKERLEALLPQRPNKQIPFPFVRLTPGLYFYRLFSNRIFPFTDKTYIEKKIIWQKELTKVNEDFDLQVKGMDINSPEYLKLFKKKDKTVQKLTNKINEGNWECELLGNNHLIFMKKMP